MNSWQVNSNISLNFLKSSLGLPEVPMHSYIILKDDIEDGVEKILKDTYHLPVIKYWKSGNKVGFILEAIGKHEFITTGFMVENDKISDAKVFELAIESGANVFGQIVVLILDLRRLWKGACIHEQ